MYLSRLATSVTSGYVSWISLIASVKMQSTAWSLQLGARALTLEGNFRQEAPNIIRRRGSCFTAFLSQSIFLVYSSSNSVAILTFFAWNWTCLRFSMHSCPGCRAIIEKNGGCNHMTCRRCQHQFYWCCGQPLSLQLAHSEVLCWPMKFVYDGSPLWGPVRKMKAS